MTATGKLTTSEIARQLATRKDVRILVRIDPDTGTVHATDRKTGASAATITKVNMVAGNRKRLYKLWTNAGPIAGAYPGNVTHWLPRAKDTDAPDSNVTESTTFEHQTSDDGGKTWRTVAVGLNVADCDNIRWDHYGEGTRFRFAADDQAEPADTDTWTERFSAGWSDGEVTVIRDVRAGISGPFGEYPAADLEEAEKVLRANGYVLSGPWSEHANGFFAPLATHHTRDEIDAYAAAMPGGSRNGMVQPPTVVIAPNHAPAASADADGKAEPVTIPLHMSGVRTGDRISDFPSAPGVLTVTKAWWHSKTLTHRFTFAETGEEVHQVDRDGAPEVVLHERPDFGPLDAVYEVGDAVRYRFGLYPDRPRYGVVTDVVEHDGVRHGYEIFGGAVCGVENMAPLDKPRREVGQVWTNTIDGRSVTVAELEDEWGTVVRTTHHQSFNLLYPGWELVGPAPAETAACVSPWTSV